VLLRHELSASDPASARTGAQPLYLGATGLPHALLEHDVTHKYAQLNCWPASLFADPVQRHDYMQTPYCLQWLHQKLGYPWSSRDEQVRVFSHDGCCFMSCPAGPFALTKRPQRKNHLFDFDTMQRRRLVLQMATSEP